MVKLKYVWNRKHGCRKNALLTPVFLCLSVSPSSVSENELDQEQVLRQYKAQMVVECQFHLLKQSALASVIFLKHRAGSMPSSCY